MPDLDHPAIDHPAIDHRVIWSLMARELRDAWRNRWFQLYSAIFTLLALALAWVGVTGIAGTGVIGFGRTAASLLNLVVLIVPLMGLTLAAGTLAGERERGSLIYLLAQPVGRLEVVLGKFLGLCSAVLAALVVGFALAALVIAGRGGGGDPGPLVRFLAFSALLALATVSLGLLVSALCDKSSVAVGMALFLWLALVFLGDLGLMGTSLVMDLRPSQLLAAALVNPLQEFTIGAVTTLRGGLESLGPAGLYAERTFGTGLPWLLAGCLMLWTLLPLAATVWVVERRGAL